MKLLFFDHSDLQKDRFFWSKLIFKPLMEFLLMQMGWGKSCWPRNQIEFSLEGTIFPLGKSLNGRLDKIL